MAELTSVLNQLGISTGGFVGQITSVLFYVVVALGVAGCAYAVAYFSAFPIKVVEFVLAGSGKKTKDMHIVNIKSNRAKWNRKKTAWQFMFPLFSKKEHPPWPDELQYNKKILAYKIGDQYIPAKADVMGHSGLLEVTPAPAHIKEWQIMERKINASEFAEQGFWAENKVHIITILAVAFCCALGALTVWLTYRFAAGESVAIKDLAESIRSLGAIPGVGPS